MKIVTQLEEVGLFLFSIYMFSRLPYPWWYFPVLFFVPDVAMLAYLAGPRIGAYVYNFIHHRAISLACYVAGMLFGLPALGLAGVILFSHSTMDRVFGYGLKFTDSFNHTHLGPIGRDAAGM